MLITATYDFIMKGHSQIKGILRKYWGGNEDVYRYDWVDKAQQHKTKYALKFQYLLSDFITDIWKAMALLFFDLAFFLSISGASTRNDWQHPI